MDRLRKLLESDQTVITAWLGLTDRFYVDSIARCGFDAVTLDMQHGLYTETSIISGVADVSKYRKPAIVRIPVGRFELASKALDIGAHAVIAPMINSVEDAREFAAYMKYPPVGERSHGITQAAKVLGCNSRPEYLSQADTATMAIAMIETVEAVNAVDAILDVNGIDGILIGPSDLSISYDQSPIPDPFGEATIDIIADLAAKTREKNKLAAVFCLTPEQVDMTHKMGYRMMAIGLDDLYIQKGAETLLAQMTFR